MKIAIMPLIAILIIGLSLASCNGPKEPDTGPDLPPDIDISDDISNGMSDDMSDIEYPITIGGVKIPMEEYAYYFFRAKTLIEQYRSETWEKESSREDLKAEALGYLAHQYTIRRMAENYGLSLDQSDRQRIISEIRALEAEKGGPDGFKRYLDENRLTEELLAHLKGADVLEEKLIAEFFEEEAPEQVIDRLNATWFRTQHIMIEVGEKYDENERREYAKSVYDRAVSGEDFSELAAEFNEDPDKEEEYFFALDERRLSYEDIVLELAPGQISEVFWSYGNLYIVKRLPLTAGQISEKSEEVRRRGSYEAFGDRFDAVRRELTIAYDPRYDSIGTFLLGGG